MVLAAVLVTLLVLLGVAYLTMRDSGPKPPTQAEVATIAGKVTKEAIDDLRSEPARSAEVYKAILPSLVEVQASDPSAAGDKTELGAGVVVSAQGSILTALHVIAGAKSIQVSFADGTRSTANVVTTDPVHDIAVLVPTRFPQVIVPATLGGAGQVGDETYAIGHPLGLHGSLTAGVISGLDRRLKGKTGNQLSGLIQFDAAVNPGSSGGPLLNRNGQVIGIVTALANPSRDGYFIGIGFAVPIGAAGGAAGAPPK
jgi:S1-C subfamily serine protease